MANHAEVIQLGWSRTSVAPAGAVDLMDGDLPLPGNGRLRPPFSGGFIRLALLPSSYRFEAICCAVSIIAASIGLISWK
jgi:hypothetical protein